MLVRRLEALRWKLGRKVISLVLCPIYMSVMVKVLKGILLIFRGDPWAVTRRDFHIL
jgi:hypothetical protein